MLLQKTHVCFVTGSIQSYRRHPQSDEHVQEVSRSEDHGQLLWKTGSRLLEGGSLPVPCCSAAKTVPAVSGDEEEYHSRGVAKVRKIINKKNIESLLLLYFLSI